MAIAFSRGFSLIEAMVSITIIGLLAVAVVVNLNASSRTEALNSAARIVAADLRSLQTRALTAQNVKICLSGTKNVICEVPGTSCSSSTGCAPAPPFSFGVHLKTSATTFVLFAEPEQTSKDWMETSGSGETLVTRDLAKLGAPQVVIDDLLAPSSRTDAHIAFERQNGRMHITPCATTPCVEELLLAIRLRHTQTNATRTVTLRSLTGRISIE